jgi:hypothetical protein
MKKQLTLAALLALVASAPGFAQNVNFSAQYEISAAVDARRAKDHPDAARYAEKMIGMFGGSIPVGTMTDVVALTPTSYRINSSVKAATMIAAVLPGDTALRTSEGSAGGGAYLTSRRFTEKRGNGEPRLVTLDYTKKVASYFKGGKITKREAIKYRTADVAALPYLFYKQPLPKAETTVAATDGISTRLMSFVPSKDSAKVAGVAIPALKLTRRIYAKDDAMIEIWVRESDGFPLRVRLDLNAKYGVIFDQRLAALPTLPK